MNQKSVALFAQRFVDTPLCKGRGLLQKGTSLSVERYTEEVVTGCISDVEVQVGSIRTSSTSSGFRSSPSGSPGGLARSASVRRTSTGRRGWMRNVLPSFFPWRGRRKFTLAALAIVALPPESRLKDNPVDLDRARRRESEMVSSSSRSGSSKNHSMSALQPTVFLEYEKDIVVPAVLSRMSPAHSSGWVRAFEGQSIVPFVADRESTMVCLRGTVGRPIVDDELLAQRPDLDRHRSFVGAQVQFAIAFGEVGMTLSPWDRSPRNSRRVPAEPACSTRGRAGCAPLDREHQSERSVGDVLGGAVGTIRRPRSRRRRTLASGCAWRSVAKPYTAPPWPDPTLVVERGQVESQAVSGRLTRFDHWGSIIDRRVPCWRRESAGRGRRRTMKLRRAAQVDDRRDQVARRAGAEQGFRRRHRSAVVTPHDSVGH